jgi:hypothetical protein
VTRLLLPRQSRFLLRLRPTTFNALWGIRTALCGLKDRYPVPIDEQGSSVPALFVSLICVGAHRERRVGREALESSSAVLQTAARPSQLPTPGGFGRERDERATWANEKRPGVALTPGLVALRKEWAMRHLRP